MLAKRIIPTLLYRGSTLVKGKQFQSWRSVGHVQQAARIHAMRGVDELVCLDIGATPEGRGPDFALVEKLTDGNFCPVTVGGGVRTVEDVKMLLRAGADKVAIGTCAANNYYLLPAVADAVGRQAVVASLDVRSGNWWIECGQKVFRISRGGRIQSMAECAVLLESRGAGEILLTSIDREGMMQGYDLDLIKAVSDAVSIPVIAHGGAGTYSDFHKAILAGADAVAAGAMFLFSDATPKGAAEYLAAQGIEVRL